MASPTPAGKGLTVWNPKEAPTADEIVALVRDNQYEWLAFYIGRGARTDEIAGTLSRYWRELKDERNFAVPMGIIMRVDPSETPTDYDASAKIGAIFFHQALGQEPNFLALHLGPELFDGSFTTNAAKNLWNRMIAGQIPKGKAVGMMVDYPEEGVVMLDDHTGPSAILRHFAERFRFTLLHVHEGALHFKNLITALRGVGEPMGFAVSANEMTDPTLDAATLDAPPTKSVPHDGAVEISEEDAKGINPEVMAQMAQGPDTPPPPPALEPAGQSAPPVFDSDGQLVQPDEETTEEKEPVGENELLD